MIPITFNGAPAFLITAEPRQNGQGTLSPSIPVDIQTGTTKREERRAYGDTLRLSYSYDGILLQQEHRTFLVSMQSITTEQVLCPLWAARRRPGESHPVTANWWTITGPSIATPQVYSTATLPNYSDPENWIIPVMVGFLASIPVPAAITNGDSFVQIDFQESGLDSISFGSYAAPLAGLPIGGVTYDVWPWRPDWTNKPTGEVFRQDVQRSQISDTRDLVSVYYAAPGYRMEKRYYTLSGWEMWNLLAYWQKNLGACTPVWLPGWTKVANVTSDISPGAVSIQVDSPANRGQSANLILDDGMNRVPIKVTSDGSGLWNLSSPISASFVADDVAPYNLMLCRPVNSALSLKFLNNALAVVEINFREIPWESISSVVGETLGVTMGRMPTQTFLYTFTMDLPVGAQKVWRFASFERSVTYAGNTYPTTKAMSHGDVTESLGLGAQTTTLDSRAFEGNPLLLLIPFQLEAPLMVEICEADVVGDVVTDTRCVFYGEVTKATFDGPLIQANCDTLGNLLDRKVPKKLIQPACNYVLFDQGCGVSRAAWKYLGQVVSWSGFPNNTLRINTITKAGVAQSGIAGHWFAGGDIAIGTGVDQQYRMIADSAAQSGANIDLTLGTNLWQVPPAGTIVELYPGCDGRYESGCTKFGNKARFGGFPFMPIGNPSLIKVQKNVSIGGKK